jgi:hypothetical protein
MSFKDSQRYRKVYSYYRPVPRPTDSFAADNQFVLDALRGIDWKQSVRVASTANIASLSGVTSIDGVSLAEEDRVLLKNQADPAENGIYVFYTSSGLSRALDASTDFLTCGATCYVDEGSANEGTFWTLTTYDPIEVGSTSQTWEKKIGVGGGGSGGAGFFFSLVDGSIYTTGSTIFRGNLGGGFQSPSSIGSDVFFFVSGSASSQNISQFDSSNKKSVFGGDVLVSGSLRVLNDIYLFSGSIQEDPGVLGNNRIVLFGNDASGTEKAATVKVAGGSNSVDSQGAGNVIIEGGTAYSGGSGGDVLINPGGGDGSGLDGALLINTNETGIVSIQPAALNRTAYTDVNFYISGSRAGAPGYDYPRRVTVLNTDVIISGSLSVYHGISGSNTTLWGGSPSFVAGPNITIRTGSNGSIEITGSASGGSGISYFVSPSAGNIYTTGSTAFSGLSGITSTANIGSDVFFWVSGSKDGLRKSVFGGDVAVSGTLYGSRFLAGTNPSKDIWLGSASIASPGGGNVFIEAQHGVSPNAPGNVVINAGNVDYPGGPSDYTGSIALHGGDVYVTASNPGGSGNFYLTADKLTIAASPTGDPWMTLKASAIYHAENGVAEDSSSAVWGLQSGGVLGNYNADLENYTLFSTSSLSDSYQRGITAAIPSGQGTKFSVASYVGDLVNNLPGINLSDVFTVDESGNVNVQGKLQANGGLSGSLQRLYNGNPYLVAGPNITITTQSNGSIAISGSAGGGSGQSYFSSPASGKIYTTGSAAFSGQSGVTLTSQVGSDVFFWVSGTIDSSTTSHPAMSVFGGDVYVSGSLSVGGLAVDTSLLEITGSLLVSGNTVLNGDLTVNGTTTTINTVNLEVKDAIIGLGFSSGTVAQTSGDRGWIGGLSTGGYNVISKWDNANSEFAFGKTTSSSTGTLPIALNGGYANLHAANIQASVVTASLGFSGSLTKLVDGTSYLVAGPGMVISTGSSGQVTLSSLQGTSGSWWNGAVTGSNDNVLTADGLGGIVAEKYFSFVSGTLGYARLEVTGALAQGRTNNAATGQYSHAEGDQTTASGFSSHAEGYKTTAQSSASHAEGSQTSALGSSSNHAEGVLTTANGYGTHAEGVSTTTIADYSHAEGTNTETRGRSSHAEGSETKTYGLSSHAEGRGAIAYGDYSHAQGLYTEASGTYSFAGGLYTIASGSGQTVFGQYNTRGNTTSLFVVGNGTADDNASRSDVLRVNQTSVEVTGSLVAVQGLSGSLTKLADGTSYLVAGSGVTISSASNGAVTISSTGGGGTPGGSDTYVQFNDGGSFGGNSGLTYNKNTNTLTGTIIAASNGFSGSLTRLYNGTSYLAAGVTSTVSQTGSISITTGSTGQVTISSYVFPNDLTVSLTGGKTFGRYASGDTIPATGKTPAEVILLALAEPINPTVSLVGTNPITSAFNLTSLTGSITGSYTINTVGASVSTAALQWRSGSSGTWNVLSTSTTNPLKYDHKLDVPSYFTTNLNYQYIIVDTAGAISTGSLTITPQSYSAPSISLTVSETTSGGITGETNSKREKGNVNSTITGTITRNRSNVPMTSYSVQYQVNGSGGWTDVPGLSGVTISGNPSSVSIPSTVHNDVSLKSSTSLVYRVQVVDGYQTTTSSSTTVSFLNVIFYAPAAAGPTDSAGVRALTNKVFTDSSNPFNLNTGTTYKDFTVAMPATLSITNVIDLDALNADITSNYVLSTFNVDDSGGTAVSYHVYTLSNAVPYGSSHRHQITRA